MHRGFETGFNKGIGNKLGLVLVTWAEGIRPGRDLHVGMRGT